MINHETIREQVADYIRGAILHNEIKPGERVLEQEIADALGVSRGPVRESLRQLEQEGLLEYRRNRGCIVRKYQKSDASEVFFLRSILEASSVMYCKGELSAETFKGMENALDQMFRVIEQNDVSGFVEQDQEFHSMIAKACGLERLYVLWNSLSPVNIALFLTDNRKDFVLRDQYQRHKRVFDVLKTGDWVAAREIIIEHYSRTTALNR